MPVKTASPIFSSGKSSSFLVDPNIITLPAAVLLAGPIITRPCAALLGDTENASAEKAIVNSSNANAKVEIIVFVISAVSWLLVYCIVGREMREP